MTANKTVEILSKEYPSAAEVASYTDEQMKQLAIHWSYILRRAVCSGSDELWKTNRKQCLDWFDSLPKEKYKQFEAYVVSTVSNFNTKPEWAVATEFLLVEIK